MKYIIGNIKMNILSISERERYFKLFRRELIGKNLKKVKIVICPPFIHSESFIGALKSKKVGIGVQNIFEEKDGAFTGEISAPMAKNLGVEYAIIGHSERRKHFGETSITANQKIKSAVKAGLAAVYCIGEKKEERESGIEQDVIAAQLQEGLADVSYAQAEKIIIAYEPVWSVGTDVIPAGNQIMEMKILIQKILTRKFGERYAQKIPILYGGSVNGKTVYQACVDPGMDGVLIGRESLEPHEFVKIAEIINEN